MKKNTAIALLINVCLAIFMIGAVASCANIIPPTGGPRDSFPPVLMNAAPLDSTLHFNTNKIVLTFDEYVTADNPQENLVVWPNPKIKPEVTSKLRTVTIKLKDTLEPNTTYTLNFGKSVKDVNEGNADSAFRYVFSTGGRLDKNGLSGKVLIAQTGAADSTLIVVLQNNLNDSAVQKNAPRYYAKLDGKGNFKFYNLPADSFRVYVVPNDYTKRYDDSTKLFAFLDKPIYLHDTTTKITLYAYAEFKAEEKRTALPSAKNNVPKKGAKKIQDTTMKVTSDLEGSRQDFLRGLELTFSDTLKSFDTSKFHLSDTDYKPLAGIKLSLDTSATKITLAYKWKPDSYYILTLDSNAAADSSGKILPKNDTLKFTSFKETDYGSIRIRFQNLDTSRHPVLQLIQNETVIDAAPLATYEWYRKFYRPGDYELRMLYDTNRNGVWDAGSFTLKKQPEIVQSVTTKKGGKITIKANLDNEYNIGL